MAPLFMSLRSKFMLITLGGAVLPLALVGFWLTASARRSGETLLRQRLDTTLTRLALDVGDRWVGRRSALLHLAEDPSVLHALARHRDTGSIAIGSSEPGLGTLHDATFMVTVRDTAGRARWVLASDANGQSRLTPVADRQFAERQGDAVSVDVPIIAAATGSRIGTLDARLRASSVLPLGGANAAGASAVLAAVDRASGVSVLPLPFDVALLAEPRFQWGGTQWLSARRELDEPALTLLAAAPLDAYVNPGRDAARQGLFALLAVAAAAVIVTSLLARRVTQSLERLASAADAVARGDLDRQLSAPPVDGASDEIDRVAHAFNSMVENLRNTLRTLSQRQAVAAVGEFAAALAHEVRNPLSAIKLNLQHAQENAPAPALQKPVSLALRDIERLERTVAGALRVARTGRVRVELVDLWATITASAQTAQPEFDRRGVTLELSQQSENAAIRVRGDPAALEQLFLNLFLNAAQATPLGASAGVVVAVQPRGVDVTIWDTGPGMTAEEREHAFRPFFSTKSEGTGLGLTLARRITEAHGGSIAFDDSPRPGTRVRVTLPV